jgi:hypothetical protein
METAAEEFVQFVSAFMKRYDEYQNPRQLYLAGDGYSAGKFIPMFTYYLDQYNKQ